MLPQFDAEYIRQSGAPKRKRNERSRSRNFGGAYLDLVNTKLNGPEPAVPAGVPPEIQAQLRVNSSRDERAFYRAELRSLNASIAVALAKARDRETREHLQGARDQIARILDPKFAVPNAAAAPAIRVGVDALDPFTGSAESLGCWPNYTIEP